MSSRTSQQQAMEAAEQTTLDPAVLASAASVALSWYYFFGRDDKMRGLFVGLWAPTIFGFASYFKQTRTSNMVKAAMGREGIAAKVQRMVEEAQA